MTRHDEPVAQSPEPSDVRADAEIIRGVIHQAKRDQRRLGDPFIGDWKPDAASAALDRLVAALAAAEERAADTEARAADTEHVTAPLRARLEGWLTEDELPGEVDLAELARRIIEWGDLAWHTAGKSEEALAAERARADKATEALQTVRAECYLPEHLAEIVGDALA